MDESESQSRRRIIRAALIIVLLCLLSHGLVLTAGFVWDDISLVRDNPSLRDVRFVPLFFITDLGKYNLVPRDMGFYRPLQSTSFLIDWHLFSGKPWGFHLVNLLLHCVASLAVFAMARRLPLSFRGAFAAGALFAVLPGKTEEVFFIANRGGVLAAVFALVSLWAYLVSIDEKKRGWYALSLGVMGLGLLSKETPIVIPAAILLTTVFFHRPKWKEGGFWQRWKLLGAGHWVVAMVYLGWRFGILGIYGTTQRPEGGIPMAMANMGTLLLSYLRILAFPIGLTPDHGFDFARPLPVATAICGWIGILLLAGFAFFFVRKAPVVTYGLLLFGLLISPLVNLIPIDRPFSEHYLYLPAAGFCLAAAALWQLLWDGPWRKPAGVLGVLVLVIFAAVTMKTATWWKDSCSLWERAYTVKPTAWVLNNLGTCYTEKGDHAKASALFAQAQELDPANYKAAYNLALDAIRASNWVEAKRQLEFALQLKPDYLRALLALGVLAYSEGLTTEELVAYSKKLSPRWVESLLGYAHAAQKQGDKEGAEKAVALYQELGGKGIHPQAEN